MDGERAPGGTVARLPSVHEQEDGTILAVCATGSSSRDSLLSWVRRLEVGIQCLSSVLENSLERDPVFATRSSSRDSTLIIWPICAQAGGGKMLPSLV